MHQNFLKVVVHVVIIDQWNKTAGLYEIQVTVIYSRAILVTLTSESNLKRVICKTWTGLTHTLQTQIRRRIMWRLIRVCTVFLNYGTLRFKWNNLKSPFRTIFLALLRDTDPSVLSVLWIKGRPLLWPMFCSSYQSPSENGLILMMLKQEPDFHFEIKGHSS